MTEILGKKNDSGKIRFSLLPLKALREVIRVLEHGAEKYGVDNWRYVEGARDRYYNAALRHFSDWYEGYLIDSDSKLAALGHVACSVLFLLALELEGKFNDK